MALAMIGATICLLSVAIAAAGAPEGEKFGRGVFALLVVGVPLVAGLYALGTATGTRFGIGLLALSCACSLAGLAGQSSSIPYTVGRLSGWLALTLVYWLLLTFPDGRIHGRFERVLAISTVAVVGVLFFAATPFVENFPARTPWGSCGVDCPANAAFLLGTEPGVVDSVVIPLRNTLLDLLLVGVAVSMFGRWHAASPVRRRMLWPVALVGTATVASHVVFSALRQSAAGSDLVDSFGAVTAVCIVAVAATFLFALVGRRLLLAEILMRLNGTTRCRTELRDRLADALEDPEIEVLSRVDAAGPWHDGAGHELAAPPEPAPGRDVTVIEGDGPALALVHAAALRDDQELVTAVGSLVLARWSNEEITAERDRALVELADARRRIDDAAEAERARIGRDLHDGVQQRLIALGIRLALAEKTLHDDPVAGARAVRGFTLEVDEALEELRSYASGSFPRVLHEHGLEGALRALARDTPLPVHVNVSGLTRHDLDIETSLYFVCAEAVQNAMKYAEASGVWIELAQDRHLRFEIRDDGVGFVLGRRETGHGLRHIRDRVHTAGGEVVIHTSPGRGTRITGTIYLQRIAPSGPRPLSKADDERKADVIIYERLLPAVPATVSQTRRELDEGLRCQGLDGAERADIALLLSEATTNVVRHAYQDGRPGPLYVVAVLRGDSLALSVIDHGGGIPSREDDAPSGLGLRLMRRLADDLDVVSGTKARGTAVHATFDHVTGTGETVLGPSTVTAVARGQLLHDYARVLAAIHPDLHDDARAALREAQHTLIDSRERWAASDRTA
ncbi:ATP-binding protein [Solirubrobacter soli]|uniref:ATP-binding protein n=1 Tax=Solirubrobacter soli TaxID=363832 RepID=UPI0003F79EFE|nr:ATP-binding protein [Solirubrobacter soli]